MWRMGRNREVDVVERKLKNVFEVELCVVAQTRAGIGSRMLAL